MAFLSSADAWSTVSTEDGMTLAVQPVSGSSHERIRVTTTTKATPAAFIDALWGKLEDRSLNPEVVKRDILEDGETARVYWDLIRSPPVTDRDYVMRSSRALDEATGVYTHRFETVSDARKKEREDIVRMVVKGSCTATPRQGGGSDVVYEVFSDVKGNIPAFLARGPGRKSALQFIREVKRRAEK